MIGPRECYRRFVAFVSHWYLVWELNVALYMLEPMEKTLIHSVLLLIIGALVYASVTYLPGHIIMMLHFLKLSEDSE